MNEAIKERYKNKKSIYAGGNKDVVICSVYSVKEALNKVSAFVADKNLNNRELRLVFRYIDEDGDDIVLTNLFISKFYDTFPFPTKFTNDVEIVGSTLFVINQKKHARTINGMTEEEFEHERREYIRELKNEELKILINLNKQKIAIPITKGMVNEFAREMNSKNKIAVNKKVDNDTLNHIYNNIDSYRLQILKHSPEFKRQIKYYKKAVIERLNWDPFTEWGKQYYLLNKASDTMCDGILKMKIGTEMFYKEIRYIANRIYIQFMPEEKQKVIVERFNENKRPISIGIFDEKYFIRHNIYNGFLKNNYVVKDNTIKNDNSYNDDDIRDSYTDPDWNEFED